MPKRIVVFRTGQLGDMLVSVPAPWAIREHFADAYITLLCDFHPDKGCVHASDVLDGDGIVEDSDFYLMNEHGGKWRRARNGLDQLKVLNYGRYDPLVYLVSSGVNLC